MFLSENGALPNAQFWHHHFQFKWHKPSSSTLPAWHAAQTGFTPWRFMPLQTNLGWEAQSDQGDHHPTRSL